MNKDRNVQFEDMLPILDDEAVAWNFDCVRDPLLNSDDLSWRCDDSTYPDLFKFFVRNFILDNFREL